MDYAIYAIAFSGALVVASMVFEYWQGRNEGLSHHISLGESALAGTILSCLACCDLIVAAVVH